MDKYNSLELDCVVEQDDSMVISYLGRRRQAFELEMYGENMIVLNEESARKLRDFLNERLD